MSATRMVVIDRFRRAFVLYVPPNFHRAVAVLSPDEARVRAAALRDGAGAVIDAEELADVLDQAATRSTARAYQNPLTGARAIVAAGRAAREVGGEDPPA